MILGLKFDRRLVAAAGLEGEQFVFGDSRFVPSRQAGLSAAMSRYLRQVLEQVKPAAIYYYAPQESGAFTTELVTILEREAANLGVPAKPLSKTDVFGSFGVLPLRTRRDLRALLEAFWPALTEGKPSRQVVLAEAAAVALVGDLHQAWPPV
jgi:hypothetical protein